jgi:hypothetical protein
MNTKEQMGDEIDMMKEAFSSQHDLGREIGRKHGTASIRPAQNRELSQNSRAEKYYNLIDDNVKMKTHQNILDGELKKMQTRLSRIH